MGVSQESILFLFVSSGGTRGEKSSSWRVREVGWREQEEEEEGRVKIWIVSEVGKLNVSILTVWKMRATWIYCWMKLVYEWGTKKRRADSLYTAGVILLLLLLSTRPQLLLGQGHLLLHVGDLLLGSSTVFLMTKPNTSARRSQASETIRQSTQRMRVFSSNVSSSPNMWRLHSSANLVLPYLSAFPSVFDAVEHGPEFCQPLSVHCSHTLHVLLQHTARVNKQSRCHTVHSWSSSFNTFHLGGHDELVVDNVVRSIAHPKQGAGRMQVAWHACPHIHVFTNALGANKCISKILICGWGKVTLCVDGCWVGAL